MRRTILIAIVTVAFFGMTAAGATAFLVGRQTVLNGIDERLLEQVSAAHTIAVDVNGSAAEFNTTRDALQAIVARVVPDRNSSTLGILGGQAAFLPAVPVPFELPADPDFVNRVLQEVSDGSVRLGTASTDVGELRYIAAPVAIDDERGVFIIAVDVRAELDEFTSAFSVYALVALGTLLIIGLVGWLVAGRLLEPLRWLREAAEDITANERSVRIPVKGDDDVSELTRTINGMLDRLDAALTSQRRLLDDVRHELKTPLTIVRGHLELMSLTDEDDIRATRLIAIDELDRMSHLIDEIEVLAESRLLPVSRVPVLASELTSEVFAKARGIRGHEWQLAVTASSVVLVDRKKIAQAWLQLVDNAVKYSPPGSTILIGSVDHQHTVEFWVQNAGPGISPGEEDRVFERSHRAHTGDAPGSGLGLSIVRSIVVAHGGRVAARSSKTGTRIGFVLPTEVAMEIVHEAVNA
ncbi:HAMP domain-containing sensor histidine kinase [soil metagenome]